MTKFTRFTYYPIFLGSRLCRFSLWKKNILNYIYTHDEPHSHTKFADLTYRIDLFVYSVQGYTGWRSFSCIINDKLKQTITFLDKILTMLSEIFKWQFPIYMWVIKICNNIVYGNIHLIQWKATCTCIPPYYFRSLKIFAEVNFMKLQKFNQITLIYRNGITCKYLKLFEF